jgi:hypothetical protein
MGAKRAVTWSESRRQAGFVGVSLFQILLGNRANFPAEANKTYSFIKQENPRSAICRGRLRVERSNPGGNRKNHREE